MVGTRTRSDSPVVDSSVVVGGGNGGGGGWWWCCCCCLCLWYRLSLVAVGCVCAVCVTAVNADAPSDVGRFSQRCRHRDVIHFIHTSTPY